MSRTFWLLEEFRGFLIKREGGCRQLSRPRPHRTHLADGPSDGADGGQVAFSSKDRERAVSQGSKGLSVVGQIRLKGRHIGRISYPDGHESKDISAEQWLKGLCLETFGVERWGGGNTGG